MKIEITKEKIKEYYGKAKTWVSENTEKVVAGAGVALGVGAVAAAVVSGRKSNNVNPLVVGIKDDWKDKLCTNVYIDGHPASVRVTERIANAFGILSVEAENKGYITHEEYLSLLNDATNRVVDDGDTFELVFEPTK